MMQRYFAQTFSIDRRSLGLFRIGIGLLLLCDLISRVIYGLDLISPQGVIPVDQALHILEGKSPLSLYLLNARPLYFYFILALSFISYTCYLIGYRTRFFGILSIVFLFSIQNRNPFVLHGGDVLLRMFLLISLFLPLQSYSITSGWKAEGERFSSLATLTLLVQIGLMYFFSALYKSGPEWFDGSALFYAFQADWIANSLGQSLAQFPALLKILTYATLGLELLVLPILFVNFKLRQIRTVLFLTLFFFHFGIFITMDIGTFPFVCMLGSFLFYPGRECPIESDFRIRGQNLLALGILILIVFCNILFFVRPEGLSPAKTTLLNLGIYQKWSMFSPSPAKSNILFEVVTDQASVADAKANYAGHHWQKFLMQIVRPNNSDILNLFGSHLCKKTHSSLIQIMLHERSIISPVTRKIIPLYSSHCAGPDAI